MRRIINKISLKIKKWTEPRLNIPVRSDIPVERLGSPYGGWIIPRHQLSAGSVCYLVGAGEDISFDLAVAQRYQCPVHIFDPTPRALTHVRQTLEQISAGQPAECTTSPGGFYPAYPADIVPGIRVHPWGIWNEDTILRFYTPQNEAHVSHSIVNLQNSATYIEVPVKRLSTVMTDLGHRKIDLLKIDTEGAEYQIIKTILDENLEVDILCVEFDESAQNHLDTEYIKRIESSMTDLRNAGYEVIAKEPESRNYTLVHQRRL